MTEQEELVTLKKLWRDKRSPYNRYICRLCAADAFPSAALAEYPLDSYHVGSRFVTFKLFGTEFDIWIDHRRPIGPCVEARAAEDGWIIEQVVYQTMAPGEYEVERCHCSIPGTYGNAAERLRFGRVKIEVKERPLLYLP